MHEETRLERAVDRRQFTLAAAMAVLSGVAITITSGCGGGGGSPTSPGTPTPTPTASGDKVGVISDNHGHSAVITGAQLTARGALVLDIKGTATHTHSVTLSAAEVTSIAGNTRVAKSSSTTSGHDHTVTFN